ncbi:MAG: nodulation protein NfeD [Candidatus Thiodiazotropha sp. (ex Monitilora ramsayi)]|nr:nodulation protein NfeD [Candidatus Thiodiazotropha sp. (ex Monitilora ramsayi)]
MCYPILLVCISGLLFAQNPERKVFLLDIDGPIGPATADYFDRSLEKAVAANAELVILRMDTPGGLDSSMRDMIKLILASEVPIVGYVAPSGARAASAGTYLLYASHVAAMAPATNLGAATPVGIGGASKPSEPGTQSEDSKTGKEQSPGNIKESKLINDASAYITGLAKLRGRNEEWAEKAVRDSASLSSEQALEMGVIDLTADSLTSLLKELNGRQVTLPQGKRELKTDGVVIEQILPDWQNKILSIVSNPNLAYILMLIGIYGLIYEFANPGSIVPGTVGAISLLLALYAFQILPINYAGVALILLGLTLMIAEAFMPSFGALGVGGVISFTIGSLILIDTDQAGYGISVPLILTVAISSGFLMVFVVGMALESRRRPIVSGREELVSSEGVVLDDFSGHGKVTVHGEIWEARSDKPLSRDQRVRIIGRDGLTLDVIPVDNEEEQL